MCSGGMWRHINEVKGCNTVKFLRLQLFFLLLVFVVGTETAHASTLYVSAAASLKESINEISEAFSRKNPAIKIVKNLGGSGALAKQIENGAPADLFISANVPWVDYLKQRALLSARSVSDLAYNTLVFVGRPGVKASSMKDLLKLDRIAIGSPRSVPAGEYAMEAFKKANIAQQLQSKLVMAKDVRECLMYAERGEVDGALVYRTDALEAKKARILFAVPQNLYERIVYPMALTAKGATNKDAQAFFRYLQGREARSILAKYGFIVK
jgi:molybdate transport system substrate-binding protein